ncbi:Reverse transcriptase domain-containing protein [Camponotus japonicus]
MISLDVCSLFTNIPKDLVINAIKKRWDDIAKNTKFNLAQFLYAIELILDSTCFAFDGRFYEQIFGSPMGSPLSPVLADMVMDDLETQCLSSLNFTVPIYYKFIDDVFAIVPRTKIDEILTTFNNYHQRLKFSYEIEVNSSISFLNATVTRFDNRLITNWYRKPTWSLGGI